MIRDVDVYFNYNYEDEWFDDPLVKQMVKDIDKSEVLSAYNVISPVLGSIPTTKISGGVKALILMYKLPGVYVWATACGDNCAEWLLKISEMQDVYIVLEHIMRFPRDFKAVCVDNAVEINSINDYLDNAFQCLFEVS